MGILRKTVILLASKNRIFSENLKSYLVLPISLVMEKAKLVIKKEIAVRYSVHPKTVEKWADAGIIPVVKINSRCVRFDLNKCDAAMERRTKISR